MKEIIRLFEDDGWMQVSQKGSHRQFKHSSKKGRVTVNGKPSDDLEPFLENSMEQAGLK
ncbi:MAG: type II toxin-antitoxin system HicA family toxin [Cytophagaceae bacterium]|nr:type II toxin-antitoxin system HicA family toxin [Cytophagaceae bacterium]